MTMPDFEKMVRDPTMPTEADKREYDECKALAFEIALVGMRKAPDLEPGKWISAVAIALGNSLGALAAIMPPEAYQEAAQRTSEVVRTHANKASFMVREAIESRGDAPQL